PKPTSGLTGSATARWCFTSTGTTPRSVRPWSAGSPRRRSTTLACGSRCRSAAKQYAEAIRELVAQGVLGFSTGAVAHLVGRTKGAVAGTMQIVSWPIAELSLTPTPAEPRTIGVTELKALALHTPSLRNWLPDWVPPDHDVDLDLEGLTARADALMPPVPEL